MFIPTTVLNVGAVAPTPDAYVNAVLADSPLGFWQMDDISGLPQDSSGNANHMTTNNGPTTKAYRLPGPFGGTYGIQMGGGSNFQRAVVTAVQDNYTLEVWLSVIIETSDDTVFVNGTRAGVGYGIDLATGTTKFRCLMGSVAFLTSSAGSYPIFPAGYKHIVIVRRAGTTEYYLNGVLDTANAGTNTPNVPTTKTQLGSDGNIALILSMVAIYDTALSSARIAAHFAAAA